METLAICVNPDMIKIPDHANKKQIKHGDIVTICHIINNAKTIHRPVTICELLEYPPYFKNGYQTMLMFPYDAFETLSRSDTLEIQKAIDKINSGK